MERGKEKGSVLVMVLLGSLGILIATTGVLFLGMSETKSTLITKNIIRAKNLAEAGLDKAISEIGSGNQDWTPPLNSYIEREFRVRLESAPHPLHPLEDIPIKVKITRLGENYFEIRSRTTVDLSPQVSPSEKEVCALVTIEPAAGGLALLGGEDTLLTSREEEVSITGGVHSNADAILDGGNRISVDAVSCVGEIVKEGNVEIGKEAENTESIPIPTPEDAGVIGYGSSLDMPLPPPTMPEYPADPLPAVVTSFDPKLDEDYPTATQELSYYQGITTGKYTYTRSQFESFRNGVDIDDDPDILKANQVIDFSAAGEGTQALLYIIGDDTGGDLSLIHI